jgi:hypothetical protein
MWLFVGEGQTMGRAVDRTKAGTDTIDLTQLICVNEETRFIPPAPSLDLRPVIISPCYFVATAIGEPNAIMSASFQVTSIPAEHNYIVTRYDGSLFDGNVALQEYKDVKVTVTSSVSGQRKGSIAYHWMCLVEVGQYHHIPG